jgi:hypothetical protein
MYNWYKIVTRTELAAQPERSSCNPNTLHSFLKPVKCIGITKQKWTAEKLPK